MFLLVLLIAPTVFINNFLLDRDPKGRHADVSTEYMEPAEENRQISTISLTAMTGKDYWESHLSLYAGGTITHAWGSITQLNSFLQTENFNNSASGLGPTVCVRLTPFPDDQFRAFLDSNGSVLFYDSRFPAGGDIYNFMFRVGPTLAFKIDADTFLSLKCQWMHVSNGQGLGPQNPSYEAIGWNLGLNWPI